MDKQKYNTLEFKNLDYAHKDLIIHYRSIGFFTSFGTKDDFFEDDSKGGERYLEWLKSRDPNRFAAFHVIVDGEIKGQLELNLLHSDLNIGYVNYYYLHESLQGQGIATKMDEFVIKYYLKKGIHKMRLAVSPSNKRAYKFYEKCGWTFLEERDYLNKEGVNLGHKIHILERSV